MRNLPPLNAVKAFEAAARHASFTLAADELGVTQTAVSRLVRTLEERLALRLFERRANGLVLTEIGRAYASGLTVALDAIADQTRRAREASAQRPALVVGVGPTFAGEVLIPRLADFHSRHPDVELRLATGGAVAPFQEDWTCAIRLGSGEWPGFVATPLIWVDLALVCTPERAGAIRSPADVLRHPLLVVAHGRGDWPIWLRAAGLGADAVKPSGPVFDTYGMALKAAADGLGLALVLDPYAETAARTGQLVEPLPLRCPKGEGWHLIYREARRDNRALQAFAGWLTEIVGGPRVAP